MAALRAELRESPSLVPVFAAVGVFTWMAADQAGYDKTTWYPAGLILLGLLAVSLVALPTPRPSRPTWIAIALLAAYAGWSYLSIIWADQKDVAWDGANRTLVYAIVLALFALWPLRPRAAAAVLGSATLAVAVVGVVTLLRANGADSLVKYFFEGRLVEPAGYVNANVALWFAAFWPAVVLAGRRELHPLLRGLFLGSACLFSGLALLGQSRGWLLALPVVALLALVLVPGRARTLVVLGAVAAVTLVISGPLLDVYDASGAEGGLGDAVSAATRALLIASAAATLLGAAAAWLDGRAATSEATDRRADRAAGLLVVLAVLGAIVALTVTVGNPLSEARDYWNEFKEGGTTPSAGEARLTGTAATDRYDFWRVGIDMFADRPLTGYGADNFQHEYFIRGKSEQQPRYPHSLEVRVLAADGDRRGSAARRGARRGLPRGRASAAGAPGPGCGSCRGGAVVCRVLARPRIARLVLGVHRPGGRRVRDAGAGGGTRRRRVPNHSARTEPEAAAGCAGAGRGMPGRSVARGPMGLGAVRAPGRVRLALGRGFRVPLPGPGGFAQPSVAGS